MYTEVIKLWKNREDVTVTSYCMDKNNEIIGCDRRPAVIVSPGGSRVSGVCPSLFCLRKGGFSERTL